MPCRDPRAAGILAVGGNDRHAPAAVVHFTIEDDRDGLAPCQARDECPGLIAGLPLALAFCAAARADAACLSCIDVGTTAKERPAMNEAPFVCCPLGREGTGPARLLYGVALCAPVCRAAYAASTRRAFAVDCGRTGVGQRRRQARYANVLMAILGEALWRRLTAMLPSRAFDLTLIKANISRAPGYFGSVSQCQTNGVA